MAEWFMQPCQRRRGGLLALRWGSKQTEKVRRDGLRGGHKRGARSGEERRFLQSVCKETEENSYKYKEPDKRYFFGAPKKSYIHPFSRLPFPRAWDSSAVLENQHH